MRLKRISLLFLLMLLVSVLAFSSCDGYGGSFTGGEPGEETPGTGDAGENDGLENVDPDVVAVYAKAQELGFEGTLDEFIERVSGRDGVGITGAKLDDKGHLIISLTSGQSIDCGNVGGKPTVDTVTVRFVLIDYEAAENGEDIPGILETSDPIATYTIAKGGVVDNEQLQIPEGYAFTGWYFLPSADATSPIQMIFYPISYAITGDITFFGAYYPISTEDPGDEELPPEPDPEPNPDYGYSWENTTISIEYSMNSGSGELSSGTQRYYAGEDTSSSDEIDESVRARNSAAAEAANVTVSTSYLSDGVADYAWGSNVQRIIQNIATASPDAPDVYVNFVYDLSLASIRGCFANLVSDNGYAYGNRFSFNEDVEYATTVDGLYGTNGNGYYDYYMRSFSLDPDNKMYLIASNWTIDVLRAMTVIPVNLQVLSGIDGNLVANDIDRLYATVYSGGWTYDLLAYYCAAVYQDIDPYSDIGDILGFCAATSHGLHSRVLTYAHQNTFIKYDDAQGRYAYPNTSDELGDLVSTLKSLFEKTGVATLSNAEAAESGYNMTDIAAIRNRFASNGILFGGVTMIGSLEDAEYQSIEEGFGIIPVPLAQSSSLCYYNSIVHNLARVAALSVNSTKLSQCSAYIDELSTNSTAVAYDYAHSVFGEYSDSDPLVSANVSMFGYLANHIYGSLDMNYEDIILEYMAATSASSDQYGWHRLIRGAEYKMSDTEFDMAYDSYVSVKDRNLMDISNVWETLP